MLSTIAAAIAARRNRAGSTMDMEGTIMTEDDWLRNKQVPSTEFCLKVGTLLRVDADTAQERDAYLRTDPSQGKPVLLLARPGSDLVISSFPVEEVAGVCLTGGNPGGSLLLEVEEGAKARKARSVIEPASFELQTLEGGRHRGRTFGFKGVDDDDTVQWCTAIHKAIEDSAAARTTKLSNYDWARICAKALYSRTETQMLISLVILSNFACAIWRSQVLPPQGSSMDQIFDDLDLAFTTIFTLELALNYFANYWTAFWEDSWNYFDTVIVCGSLLLIAFEDAPGIQLLRLVRVLRVMRLFKRMRSLRVLMNALFASMIPVAHAFLILALFTFIFAVLGVEFFADTDPEYFGNFFAALFTMFQTCTGDSWASTIARPLFIKSGASSNSPDALVSVFFTAYIIIVGTVLINVVIAVLLDEFISAVQEDKAARKEEIMRATLSQDKSPGSVLDPLLAYLASFENSKDLSDKIERIYVQVDEDESGGVSFAELQAGLMKIETNPMISITEDDFEMMTEGGVLSNSDGEIDLVTFEAIIRRQVSLYVQRRIAAAVTEAVANEHMTAPVLLGVKQMLLALEPLTPRCRWQPETTATPERSSPRGAGSQASEIPDPEADSLAPLPPRLRFAGVKVSGVGPGTEGLRIGGLELEPLPEVSEHSRNSSEEWGSEGLGSQEPGSQGSQGLGSMAVEGLRGEGAEGLWGVKETTNAQLSRLESKVEGLDSRFGGLESRLDLILKHLGAQGFEGPRRQGAETLSNQKTEGLRSQGAEEPKRQGTEELHKRMEAETFGTEGVRGQGADDNPSTLQGAEEAKGLISRGAPGLKGQGAEALRGQGAEKLSSQGVKGFKIQKGATGSRELSLRFSLGLGAPQPLSPTFPALAGSSRVSNDSNQDNDEGLGNPGAEGLGAEDSRGAGGRKGLRKLGVEGLRELGVEELNVVLTESAEELESKTLELREPYGAERSSPGDVRELSILAPNTLISREPEDRGFERIPSRERAEGIQIRNRLNLGFEIIQGEEHHQRQRGNLI